jgi:hypothetical protein
MTSQSYGSVVAMEFKARPSIDFADIVEEFDIAFQMVDSRTRSLTWDRDDVAMIDRDYVRVAMGWLPATEKGEAWHLIIAVGSAPGEDLSKIEPASYDFVADRILDRTSEFLPSTAVLRGEANQPIGPELIDTLCDLLRMDPQDMAGDSDVQEQIITDEELDDYADIVSDMNPPWARAAKNDRAYSKAEFDAAEKAAQFGDAEGRGPMLITGSECSQPMRLTIHTLALSMCLYVPPLGAAMFAYTMMRDIFPVAATAI